MTAQDEVAEQFWRAAARRTSILINGAWIVQQSIPAIIACALAGLPPLLLYRERVIAWSIFVTIAGVLGSLAVIFVWQTARRRFVTVSHSLVKLEDALGLNSALTAADAGVIRWPAPIRPLPRLYKLNVAPLFAPLAATALLVGVAAWLPASEALQQQPVSSEREPPFAVAEISKAIEELRSSGKIDQDRIEQFNQQLETLLQQPEERWYDHESLEAADALKERLEGAVEHTLGSLQQLEAAARAVESDGAGLTAEERAEISAAVERALGNLAQGDLALNQESTEMLNQLAEQLAKGGQASQSMMRDLQSTIRRLQQLQDGESRNATSSGAAASNQGGSCAGAGDSAPMCGAFSESEDGSGSNGTGDTGRAGISRGPGHVPLDLAEKPPQITSNLRERLNQNGGAEEQTGELVGITRRAPDAEDSVTALERGGALNAPQIDEQGTAWREELTPDEEEAVRRFFR